MSRRAVRLVSAAASKSCVPSPTSPPLHQAPVPLPPPSIRTRDAASCVFPLLLLLSSSGSALVLTAMAAAAEWWQATIAAAYTGLSPAAAFFTAVAVAAALYVAVSGLLKRPAPPLLPPRRRGVMEEERASQPLPPPVQLGEVTEEELKVYDGSDPKKPLLMAIKGQIYDVTQSRMFYGPGGPYALFAGRDASRALAKMSFDPDDLTSEISGLGPFELEALQEWEGKFMGKYVKVGTIKKITPVLEGDAAALPTHGRASERGIDASTVESHPVPKPEVEKLDVDVSTNSHEDLIEMPDELPESGVNNTNSHEDAAEKPEETADADVQKTISTEDASEANGTPDEDERNTISPDDAIEKPQEAPIVDEGNQTRHEVAGEPKEVPDVNISNTSSHQDAVDEPEEASHEEANAYS